MKKLSRKLVWLLLIVFVFTVGSGFSVRKAAALPAVGETVSGFRAERTERLAALGGSITYLTHEATGAQAVFIEVPGARPELLLSFRTNAGIRRFAFTADTSEELLRGARERLGAPVNIPAWPEEPGTDAAYRLFLQILLPGSDAAGGAAGTAAEDEPLYAENALAVLCAAAEDGGKLLAALDDAFSTAAGGTATSADAAYRRMEKAAEETVPLVSADGSGGGVYFGLVCPRAGEWTRARLAAVAAALGKSGSALEKGVRAALPGTDVTCGTESAGTDAAIWFFAPGLGEKDAETFRNTVIAALRGIGDSGLPALAAEKLEAAQRLEALTFPERPDLGEQLCAGFAAAWARGDVSAYPAQLAGAWNAAALFADGSCSEVLRAEVLPGEYTALVTVVPELPEPPEEPEEETPAEEDPSGLPAAGQIT